VKSIAFRRWFVTLELRLRGANQARYWAVIALVRTTGTVAGDYLTSEEGLGLGFAIGASVSLIALLTGLIGLRAFRIFQMSKSAPEI
jgi:uncharacterized membrane-anchored protein